ncbi:hypothetical protein HMPREF1403_00231 [Helicobacter pylori GAM201Ai]|nr:hypothetical protein HMPREF1403_00231 [Helicobacter pylori GAM201Ai]
MKNGGVLLRHPPMVSYDPRPVNFGGFFLMIMRIKKGVLPPKSYFDFFQYFWFVGI